MADPCRVCEYYASRHEYWVPARVRLDAAEEAIDAALFQLAGHPALYPRALIIETLRKYREGTVRVYRGN